MFAKKSSSPVAEGLHRALPIVLGYLPVGFAFGVLAVKNNIPASLAIAMSLTMFSGSGQLIFASMWGVGASVLSIIAAVGVANLRYLLQSAAECPWMGGLSRVQRLLLGFGLTDETFAVHVTALQHGWERNLTTLFVCNHVAQLGWVGGTVLGVFCGDLVQDVRPLGLDYALTAMFLALLVLQFRNRLQIVIGCLTLAMSVAFKFWGMTQWNIALAAVLGATLGCFLSPKGEEEPS